VCLLDTDMSESLKFPDWQNLLPQWGGAGWFSFLGCLHEDPAGGLGGLGSWAGV
jgi:hypothetical protein